MDSLRYFLEKNQPRFELCYHYSEAILSCIQRHTKAYVEQSVGLQLGGAIAAVFLRSTPYIRMVSVTQVRLKHFRGES